LSPLAPPPSPAQVEDACAFYLPCAPTTPPNTPSSEDEGDGDGGGSRRPLSTQGRAGAPASGSNTPNASVTGGLEGSHSASDADSWQPARGAASSSARSGRTGGSSSSRGGAGGGGAAAAAGGASASRRGRSGPLPSAVDATPDSGWRGEREGRGGAGTPPLRRSISANSLGVSGSASDYDPAASQFPSRRSSLDSNTSAQLPSTPAALAAAQALLRGAGPDRGQARGLSRASSCQAPDGMWRSPRGGGPGGLSGAASGSLLDGFGAAGPLGRWSVSSSQQQLGGGEGSGRFGGGGGGRYGSGSLAADASILGGCVGNGTGGGGGGGSQGRAAVDGAPLIQLQPTLSLTSLMDSAPSGDIPRPPSWPRLDQAAGGSARVRVAGGGSSNSLHLLPQPQPPQPGNPQFSPQQPFAHQPQPDAREPGLAPVQLLQRRRPQAQVAPLVTPGAAQQPRSNGPTDGGAVARASRGGQGGPHAVVDPSPPRNACPLCSQALPTPASGAAALGRQSPPLLRTPPAAGGGGGYRRPRPSPVRPLRSARQLARELDAAPAAAAGGPAGAITGAGCKPAAQQPHLVRSGSAEWRAPLSDPGSECDGSAAGAADGSTPTSPHLACSVGGGAAPARPPTAAGADPQGLLLAAAALTASGGRSAQAGRYKCCTLVLTFTDPGLPRALSRLVKVRAKGGLGLVAWP
jgi:hypothetical protein